VFEGVNRIKIVLIAVVLLVTMVVSFAVPVAAQQGGTVVYLPGFGPGGIGGTFDCTDGPPFTSSFPHPGGNCDYLHPGPPADLFCDTHTTLTHVSANSGLEEIIPGYICTSEPTSPLSIHKSADFPAGRVVGEPLIFTITETNNQASTFPEVAVRDLLPDEVTFVSATPSQGECDYAPSVNNVFCELGDIPAGGSATVDIVVIPTTERFVIANTAYDILNNRAQTSVEFTPLP
jgi:uncharacterized repeat protein (TIGR01451 family)